ncbi:MAG: hypothetical protein K2J47_00070 [Ruminococcus sp.]|nr:hypothetical protein [Ruminococcus sp.]
MKTTYKGAFWIPLIIGVVIAVVVIGVILYAFGGKGFGGGKGDGDGERSNSLSEISSISESSQLETEGIEYINITVSGSDYLFQNRKMTVDELIAELNNSDEKFPVKITDDDASIKAYDALVKALKDNNVRYIEQEGN